MRGSSGAAGELRRRCSMLSRMGSPTSMPAGAPSSQWRSQSIHTPQSAASLPPSFDRGRLQGSAWGTWGTQRGGVEEGHTSTGVSAGVACSAAQAASHLTRPRTPHSPLVLILHGHASEQNPHYILWYVDDSTCRSLGQKHSSGCPTCCIVHRVGLVGFRRRMLYTDVVNHCNLVPRIVQQEGPYKVQAPP